MKKTIQLMAGLMAATFITAGSALGQVDDPNYATPPYTIFTIAGTPSTQGSQNGLNGSGLFTLPEYLIADTNDNLYVVDAGANTVSKVSPAGGTNWQVKVIAGSLNNANFDQPQGIAMDVSNNLYVADSYNCTLRKITPSGNNWVVTTIAGSFQAFDYADGTNGTAEFSGPSGIAVDASGNLYVADTYNEVIRKVTPMGTNWVVTTIAGMAQNPGGADGTNLTAQFYTPTGIAIDGAGNLFVADNYNSTIREIVPMGTNWIVTTIAGSPFGYGIVDGTNTEAWFNGPTGIAVDANDNLYVADSGDNVIRKISPVGTNWVTTTLAGSPTEAPGYTNGVGSTVLFNNPFGVAVDTSGKIFVADTENYVIREGYVAALPSLNIGTDGNGNVVVSWPGSFGTVQTNSDLTTSNWAAYGGAVSNSNGTNSVTIAPASTALYFRLTN